MNDERQDPSLPHFLRVIRSIANVSGPVVPLAAVFTTVVASAGCTPCDGFCGAGYIGAGGATGTTTYVETGTTTYIESGTTAMTTSELGTTTMSDDGGPDGGDDAGDAGDGGKIIGVIVMPDGGVDAGPG